MASTIVLTAGSMSDRRDAKPFVARIVGRDPKWTFHREFLAHNVRVDELGLYQTRDVNRHGYYTDRYIVVWQDGEDLDEVRISEEKAMRLARDLETLGSARERTARINAIGRESKIALHKRKLAESEKRGAPDEQYSDLIREAEGLEVKSDARRAEVMAARRAEIERLSGSAPLDRAALKAEREKLLARVAEIDRLLAAKPSTKRQGPVRSLFGVPKGAIAKTKTAPARSIKKAAKKAAVPSRSRRDSPDAAQGARTARKVPR